MKTDVSVLVVDDEAKIIDIVESYLKKDGYVVFTAKTGKEALAILKENEIDLVLLDLMLPDLSGEEVCRRIRKETNTPVIMMTAKVSEDSIINGLSIGADDYVTKPFSPRQLMARVVAVLRRTEIRPKNKIMTSGVICVDTDKRTVTKNGNPIVLTPNEFKILALLIAYRQKTFTRDEIITNIKDDEYDGFDRTIDSHIKNLRQKIEDNPKDPKYIVTVYGMGYTFGGDR